MCRPKHTCVLGPCHCQKYSWGLVSRRVPPPLLMLPFAGPMLVPSWACLRGEPCLGPRVLVEVESEQSQVPGWQGPQDAAIASAGPSLILRCDSHSQAGPGSSDWDCVGDQSTTLPLPRVLIPEVAPAHSWVWESETQPKPKPNSRAVPLGVH